VDLQWRPLQNKYNPEVPIYSLQIAPAGCIYKHANGQENKLSFWQQLRLAPGTIHPDLEKG